MQAMNDWHILSKMKKKYGILCCVLILVIIILFTIRLDLPKQVAFFILFLNILLVLSVGKFAVKLIAYLPFKESDEEIINQLKELPDMYGIINSVVLNNEKYQGFFHHIIVSPSKVYFIHNKKTSKSRLEKDKSIIDDMMEVNNLHLPYELIYTRTDLNNLIDILRVKAQVDETEVQEKMLVLIMRMAL